MILARTITRTVAATTLGLAMLTFSMGVLPAQGQETETPIPEKMVYIDFGPFIMGLNKSPEDRKATAKTTKKDQTLYERRMSMPWSAEAFHDEQPARLAVLDPYYIDRYEVSNQDYAEFMKSTNSAAPAYWDDPRLTNPKQPVVGVNWFEAKAFCEWSGKRLPTEAEWEKAARGPLGNRYPWGDQLDPAKANYGKNHKATVPVDANPEGASYYGVYHMAGNVFEWVADWYDPTYYQKTSQVLNPTGPAEPVWLGGTGTFVDRLTVGEKRVIRGGSWIAAASSITTTHRFWNDPMNNSYGVGLGFRCAMDAPNTLQEEIRAASIAAYVSMGKEQYAEAKAHVERALKLSPANEDLRQLMDLIKATMKKSPSRS